MAEVNTSNIGFEKQIWEAACVLRGNIDASEYKSVVLGLIFLKYISDRFEAKYQELVEEGDGFEEDIDEYISEYSKNLWMEGIEKMIYKNEDTIFPIVSLFCYIFHNTFCSFSS